MNLLTARFFVLPAATLAVIVALAQAQGQAGTRATDPVVNRPTQCSTAKVLDASCTLALNVTGATVMR